MRIPTLLPAAAALLVLLLAVAVAGAAADVGQEEVAALAAELGQLRAKASALEASIVVKTQELKSKDGGIETKEKVIGEMSQNIATLQNEIASLQSKGSIAAEEQASKASARAIELEKQIEKLKKDIDAKKSKKATMEARASDAEKKVQELNAKLERLQKTSAEQKRRVQKTQQALKVAEEELMRVQLEATTKSEQLGEVHGAWLPPWLATHAARSMELISSHWNEHGKPAFKSLLQKASEKSVQAKEWAKPHMETAKAKWIPVIKEKWAITKTHMEPYVQMVSAKSVEVYQASRDAISPHVLKAHQFADPYFQEAKKLSKPYIDQVAKASKPHVEKLKTTLKPYSTKAGHAYEKFLEMATLYHEQVHGAWLPPWLATHAARSMELMSSQWIEHGKPAFNGLLQKASEKSVQATEWAKPHMETAKEKWIPVIKENWVAAKTNTEPYVQIVSAKSVEVYEASRDAISPHVLKAHEFAGPYFQEAKKLSKSYIDQVAKASKPHVEKLKTTLNAYTEEAGQA